MTITEAITSADKLCPNNEYTRAEKTGWLARLDKQIEQEIMVGMGEEASGFPGYDETDSDTVLLVPFPYDELYIFYLKSQMELYSGDMNQYSASAAVFNDMWQRFRNQYNRRHAAHNVPLQF